MAEVRQLGEISVCANPNALPYAADDPRTAGFQIEIERALAARLGVRLRVDVAKGTGGTVIVEYSIKGIDGNGRRFSTRRWPSTGSGRGASGVLECSTTICPE